jgi:hypothetical protein
LKEKREEKSVATLALGSRPRQGVARLQAKRKEARESRQRHGKVASQEDGSLGAKAKALEGCGPKGSPGVTTHSREFKEVQGSEHSHSQGNSHFGRGSPSGLPKLQRAI